MGICDAVYLAYICNLAEFTYLQRWGAIRRRTDTSNTSTQTGLQRTEAQMAANRALSLAVGNRLPSKKLAVGTSNRRFFQLIVLFSSSSRLCYTCL